jgi:DegV family protein with EDD domain
MAKVRIITDSACDLPDEVTERLNITVVPLTIRFGEEEFVDRQDLSPDEFWAKCKESKVLPETAAPSPGAFRNAYEQAAADGCDGVVVITLSAKLSATNQAATLGAESFEGSMPIRVVDSTAVTLAEGLIAVEAAEAAATGANVDECEALARSLVGRIDVVGAIDTLEHLIKGGRVKGAKALLGSMLSVKPLLALKDGEVVEAGRQRTRSKALAAISESAHAAQPLVRLGIAHGNADDIDAFVAMLADIPVDKETIVANMGSVVGTHGGPGIIGVCWIKK